MFRVTVASQNIDNDQNVIIKDFLTENALKTYIDEIDFSEVVTMVVTYHNSSRVIFE